MEYELKTFFEKYGGMTIFLSFCLVEPFSRVVLLFLIDHDSDHEAGDTAKHSQQQQKEEFHPAHRAGLRVVAVVPGTEKKPNSMQL